MELSQLRYFMEVAKLQHVTRAAENMHIAQPALTQSIHRLEAELGVPLFVSKGRNIVLTEYGRYLQSRLQPVMDTLKRVPHDLKTMADIENTTLHMNVLAASYLVTHSIIEYKKQERHINFKLVQNSGEKLSDISISTRLFYHRQGDGCEDFHVFTEKIFLAVPANGKYSAEQKIDLTAMKNEEFICLAGSKQFRAICDTLCAHAGFSPNVVFESDNPTAVKNLIAAGIGVGFWPEYTWGKLNTDDVLLLPVENPVCQRDIIISYYNNKADSSEVRRFFDFMSDYFDALRDDAAR